MSMKTKLTKNKISKFQNPNQVHRYHHAIWFYKGIKLNGQVGIQLLDENKLSKDFLKMTL